MLWVIDGPSMCLFSSWLLVLGNKTGLRFWYDPIFCYTQLKAMNLLKLTTSVIWGCCNKIPQSEWLLQQKCLVGWFWRLQCQRKELAGHCFVLHFDLFSWLMDGYPLSISSRILFYVSMFSVSLCSFAPLFNSVLVKLFYSPPRRPRLKALSKAVTL